MDRLTCKYDEQNALRELCSFGRKSDIEADDCLKCDEYCDMVVKECTYADYPCDKCAIQTAFDKLAEYEDLEEQGLLLKLPCKLGTTVYVVGTRCLAGEEPEKGCTFLDCEECTYDKTYTVFERKVDNMMMYHFLVGDNENFIFNKSVFLTKEAAEQELERIMSKKV